MEEEKKTNSKKSSEIAFKSVKIGNQEWMSDNLNVDHFRNGDCIMGFLPTTRSIASRYCRSIEEYEQNRSGRSYRERMVAIADMLHGHNCCGEVLA